MSEEEIIEATSLDAFLGGKISLFQPKDGYRVNTDSILLAAAIGATKGQKILELGCGVGAVLFSLMSRVNGLNAVGIESQKKYASLASRNAIYNGFRADIVTCDITEMPSNYKNLQYDHVVLNPPFFSLGRSMRIKSFDKDIAKREINISLDDWIEIAIKRCRANGEIVLIHQVERLPQILRSLDKKFGDIKILPISSFCDEDAKRIIVKGKKGSASPFKILPSFVLHKSSKLHNSTKNYTDRAEGVLRKGDAIKW